MTRSRIRAASGSAWLLLLVLVGMVGARPEAAGGPYFLRAWGGEGEFVRRPQEVIVTPNRTLIVSNTILNRITLFKPDRSFDNWGEVGDAPGQFAVEPVGIALDDDQRLYITDRGPDLQVFDLEGHLLDTFSIPGAEPLAVRLIDVIVGGDKVYVAAVGAPLHIHVFALDGSYLGGWGQSGSGTGQLDEVSGLALDAVRGWLYVVDSPRSRVLKFTTAGAFLKQWGSDGNAPGQFAQANRAAVDAAGRVYVVDIDNDNVQVFDSDGNFLTRFIGSPKGGNLLNPRGVFVAPDNGDVYVVDDAYVRRYVSSTFLDNDPTTDPFDRLWGREPLEFMRTQAIVYGADGNVYAADRAQTTAGAYVGHVYDRYGTLRSTWSIGNFIVTGMSQDAAGNIYVTAANHHVVAKFSFDDSLKATQVWIKGGGIGNSNDKFSRPSDLASDAAGNLFVADRNNHRIQVFDTNGNYIRTIANPGSGPGQFGRPVSLDFDADGNLYLFELDNMRVQKYRPDGGFLREWGGEGTGDGQFTHPPVTAPMAIFTYPKLVVQGDRVYVTDPMLGRVQVFDLEGVFLAAWGARGANVAEFEPEMGMDVAPNGDIYVADGGNSRIQVFSFATSPDDPAARLLVNGDMESNPPLSGWNYSVARGRVLPTTRQAGAPPGGTGNYVMRIGQPVAQEAQQQQTARASQIVYVHPDLARPMLTFDHNLHVNDVIHYSNVRLEVTDAFGVNTLESVEFGYNACNLAPLNAGALAMGWRTAGFDLTPYRGQYVRVIFSIRNVWPASKGIWAELDNVAVANAPAPAHRSFLPAASWTCGP